MEMKKIKMKKKKRVLANKQNIRDPSYKTDVFTVRVALREAYRNMPHDDFGKLVNYVLRGLKLMKHYGDGGKASGRVTYWHCDDPTFKYSMGGDLGLNAYARQLLVQVGFVCVRDIYWVWPEKHLKLWGDDAKGSWANRIVPHGCQGLDKMRITDMINLFTDCQKCFVKSGTKFNGHCKNKK